MKTAYVPQRVTAQTRLTLVLLAFQLYALRAGIDESIRVEPTMLRTLDSIAPKSRLIFKTKQGQEYVLLGDNINMSLYGVDESFNTTWTWTPKSSTIRYAALAGIRMLDEGLGESLVANRGAVNDIYRYSFRNGKTVDSSVVDLPRPPYHIIQNVDAKGDLMAFTALVQTLTQDTLYAYVVDTATGWHSIFKLPVSSDVSYVGASIIRIVDSSIAVYWQEQISGIDYRHRIIVKRLDSDSILQSVVLSDTNEPRYQVGSIVVSERDRSLVLIALATSRHVPAFGLKYWRFSLETGKVDSASEYLPVYMYLTIQDASFTTDQKLTVVGCIMDVDQSTLQLVESSSRGFLCDFDSVGKVRRFLSMQEQRPTSISSLYQDQDRLLLCVRGQDGSQNIARLDEDRITSVIHNIRDDCTTLQHIGWFDMVGRSIQGPLSGTVIELLVCVHGCYHSRLKWYGDK